MSRRGMFRWRKTLSISGQDPLYKVRYLGNVQTAMMKGAGCVDRPASTLWSNYLRCPNMGLNMKVELTASGLKAHTKEQGLTEYRAHRISYCIAHPDYPRLFLWVYRHQAKGLKMELRCHAVLCKSEVKAKSMALQLHEKLTSALQEFQKEKLRKQKCRQVLLRTNSLPQAGSILPLRTQLLSTANNFKPPICKSSSAPRLGDIHEGHEEEQEEREEEEEGEKEEDGEDEEEDHLVFSRTEASAKSQNSDVESGGAVLDALNLEAPGAEVQDFHVVPLIEVEMGNDMEELRSDRAVQYCVQDMADSDDDSWESGFQDQQDRDRRVGEGEGGVGGERVRKDSGQNVTLLPLGDADVEPSSCH